MSWLASLVIGAVSAVVGGLAVGTAAGLHADWHGVSNREGAVGYVVVFLGLLGVVGGFTAGVVISRVLGAETLVDHAKALGAAAGAIVAICGAGVGLSYLAADFPPTIDGHELELAVEVRLPEGVELGMLSKDNVPASVALYGGQTYAGQGAVRLDEARQEADGRWVVPARVYIGSGAGDRRLVVTVGGASGLYIPIPLGGSPGEADRSWSGWHGVAYLGDLSKPSAEQALEARYRVVNYGE